MSKLMGMPAAFALGAACLCARHDAAWAQTQALAVAPAAPVAAAARAATVAGGVSASSAEVFPAIAPIGAKIFPLLEVRRGLRGVAYTVFEGVTPEPMGVEILGVLTDAIGPGQDMILARLRGEKPEYTGVVAGMSGSPVYIDGRLVGAISYRIGQFSKEPIAGITPIEQMLEVRDGQPGGGMRVASAARETPDHTGNNSQPSAMSAGGEVQPIETALVFGGFSQDAVTRFGDRFRALGMSPVAGLGGAAAVGTRQPEPLVPGSAVSAILVRGDLSISGTCTVTYVDPTRLLACGHPITQFGPVSMPMTKAEVVATLASPLNAFKIINTTETVGSFTEDRASAIMGRFGVPARMIPVSVEIVPPGGNGAVPVPVERVAAKQVAAQIGGAGGSPPMPVPDAGPLVMGKGGMHFEVLDNRELTPAAMLVSVFQSLSGTNASTNETSYRMSGELTLKGLPAVRLEGMMAPSESNAGAGAAAAYVSERFDRLYSNTLEQPVVTGLRLKMEAIPERRSAVLEGARLGETEAHAGGTLDVEATLHPYGAEERVVRMRVKLPETLTPGPLRLVVSDGATLDRLTTSVAAGMFGGTAHPISLEDTVAQMNRMHANDRVYVSLLDHTPQAQLDTEALPGVPLSMANVLEPLKASQKVELTGESVVEAGSLETEYAVSGSQVLTLDVR